MAFFMNPGEMFLGCLNGVEQKFLVKLIRTAQQSGYTRFVEPCAGTFAMANLAVRSGFKPEQIETSDVSMMTSVMGYAITGQSLEPLEQYDKLLSPAVQFDFKNITFSFLPHQVKDMDVLVKNLEHTAPEIIGVAPYEQCKSFIEALNKYQKFSDIRNVGAAIHSMIQAVNEKMDDAGYTEEEDWTYLTKLFGSNAIPASSAEIITKAIKKAEKEGMVTTKNRWEWIVNMASDYLEGK